MPSKQFEISSMTPVSFVESLAFAEPVAIETGKPFCSTATCIFVPVILLNPSNPTASPPFQMEWMMNHLISFSGWFCSVCVLILLQTAESFSKLPLAAKSSTFCLQWNHHRILLASRSACILKSERR